MKKMAVLVLVLSIIFLCSCGMAIKKNNENLINLKIGMTTEDVIAQMRVPVASESYESAGGDRITILYYKTEEKETAKMSIKEECTPVVFVDGRLEGWGDRILISEINTLKVKMK